MPAGSAENGFAPAEDPGRPAPQTGRVARGWQAWRHWRHTRPFWGGLLVILGAAEILLSEKGPLPLIIHIGLQGAAGYLIPIIMVLCGLLLLFHPVQRTFYSILAVVLALGSWITSNLGGFFVGMLLGLVGGSLAFAWQIRDQPGPGKRRHGRRDQPGPVAEHEEPEQEQPGGGGLWGSAKAWHSVGPLAPAASLALSILVVPGLHSPVHTAPPPRPAPSPTADAPLSFASTAHSSLSAVSAMLAGLSFDGIATVRTAAGEVLMLKLSMDSLTLSGTTSLLVGQDGDTSAADDYFLGFSGQVVLYTTKISGNLDGAGVTFSPERLPLGLPPELALTSFVADQPYISADSVQASGSQTTEGTSA